MRTLIGALAISLLGWLPARQATGGQTAQQTMSNVSMTAAVQRKLTTDRLNNFARVNVEAEQGIVYLSGTVQTSDQRVRAEELAKQVKGVTRVDNLLHVQTAQK